MSVSLNDMSPYARSVVERLGLEPHPEGGWYVRDWQSPINDPSGHRPLSSLIYFLLAEGDASAWHKVDADEIWLWHGPAPVTIEMAGSGEAPDETAVRTVVLGTGIAASEGGDAAPVGHLVGNNEPPRRREDHQLRRKPRPSARGRQDHHLPPHRRRHVLAHAD